MTRRVMMVEDDEQVRLIVDRLLRRKGWQFRGVPTAEQAVETAASFRPDAILLDVELPGADGYEACRLLKADPDLAAIPVVMVSGTRLHPAEKARGLEAGADDFLAKPFDGTELFLRLEAILKVRG